MSYERLTEKADNEYGYKIKGYEERIDDFNTYEAYNRYNLAVKRLGELEDNATAAKITEEDLKSIAILRAEKSRAEKLIMNLKSTNNAKSYIKVLEKTKAEIIEKKAELEKFIHNVEDAEIRLIMKLKFIDGRSWTYIARTMHYDRTTLYKRYKRFIQGKEKNGK